MPELSLVPSYVVAGAVLGSMYALMAFALVLNYRATRVINLALGGMGAFGLYVFARAAEWMPRVPALLLGMMAAGALGAVIGTVSDAGAERSSALNRTLATLGWLIAITGVMAVVFGSGGAGGEMGGDRPKAFIDNTYAFRIGDVNLTWAQVAMLVVTAVVLVTMLVFFRSTRLGVAMRAVAENPTAARILGIRVAVVIVSAWVLAGLIACIAAVFVSPFVPSAGPTTLTGLLIQAYAAALIGRLRSLWITAATGIAIGVAESLFISAPALSNVPIRAGFPFLAIVGFLVLRGRELGAEAELEAA